VAFTNMMLTPIQHRLYKYDWND